VVICEKITVRLLPVQDSVWDWRLEQHSRYLLGRLGEVYPSAGGLPGRLEVHLDSVRNWADGSLHVSISVQGVQTP